MKQFTTIKVGYTSGIYGCSNEFFTTIIVTDNDMYGFNFKGMYGVEERVNKALKEKGYTYRYIKSDYGKMTAKDVFPIFEYENQILEYIEENL